jgi:hypothetical protein
LLASIRAIQSSSRLRSAYISDAQILAPEALATARAIEAELADLDARVLCPSSHELNLLEELQKGPRQGDSDVYAQSAGKLLEMQEEWKTGPAGGDFAGHDGAPRLWLPCIVLLLRLVGD